MTSPGKAAHPASPPAARTRRRRRRRRRPILRRLLASVLVFEAIVLILAVPVAITI